ncbi:hypothetical protein SAMN04489726_4664 [Allokutzneria albata]|uniref:Uncharacterized protein n=1 Tax=Allokutzneria albata TaxID=211114 RepID=A0A1G9Y8M0_ALLAB|nr:hypothetical protein SAMN04489726_4664 [Allokutzneria albata]
MAKARSNAPCLKEVSGGSGLIPSSLPHLDRTAPRTRRPSCRCPQRSSGLIELTGTVLLSCLSMAPAGAPPHQRPACWKSRPQGPRGPPPTSSASTMACMRVYGSTCSPSRGGEDWDDLMSRKNSRRDAIEAWIRCTGEPYRHAGRSIAAAERASAEVGRSVGLDAVSLRQQELEAAVLLALRHVSSVLYDRDEQRAGFPFRYVVPRHDRLRLALAPGALDPLVFALLPNEYDGELVGVAGLRAVPHSSGVTLTLLDATGAQTDAQVTLMGVGRKDWAVAVAEADSRHGRPSFIHEQRLAAREHQELSRYPLTGAHPAMASAMLRRLNLLRSACWFSAWTDDLTVTVEWCGGHSLIQAATLLTDPHLGLPAAEVVRGVTSESPGHDPWLSIAIHGPTLPTRGASNPQRGYPEGALLLRRMSSCRHTPGVPPGQTNRLTGLRLRQQARRQAMRQRHSPGDGPSSAQ